MKPYLSICIPTFNRAEFLEKLLIDILSNENSDKIEIVISDNASTDNTDEVIEKYKKKFTYFIHSKFDENKGPDVNFLNCVRLATSEYCWLMGSDDSIQSEGINSIIENLKKYEPAVALINITECDYSLTAIGEHNWISEPDKLVFNTKNINELIDFFNAANPLWGLFLGYISAIVVKKSEWDAIEYNEEFNGTLFSFTSILMEIIVKGCIVTSIKKPVVLNRGYNDSMVLELNGNQFARLVLDLDIYILFSKMMPCLNSKKAYLELARRNYGFYYILKIILSSKNKEWHEVKEKFITIGVDQKILNTVEIFNIFKSVLNLMLRLRIKYLPKRRIL